MRTASLIVLFAALVNAQSLSDAQVQRVRARMNDGSKAASVFLPTLPNIPFLTFSRSWETGTAMQTLIELDTPSFSVLTPNATVPPPRSAPSSLSAVIQSARSIVQKRKPGSTQLVPSSSAADPASNGVAVLLADWTHVGGADFSEAARAQLEHLLTGVPRSKEGAISHREGYLQVW